MKRGSSLRFMEWPMPLILASVLSSLIADLLKRSTLRLAHFLGRILHGLDDIDVARAAAQVPGNGLADLLLARVLVALQERARGHQHAGGAEAALQAVLLGEALLDGMELARLLQALDRGDLRAVGLHREHGARLDRVAVEDHGARAAVRGVAADVGAGHPEHFADEVHEQEPRLDFRLARGAVDGHADLVFGHDYFPPARWTALSSA